MEMMRKLKYLEYETFYTKEEKHSQPWQNLLP